MAGEEEGGEDRTEAPTPRRLEKAREEGQVALSRELVAFATLGLGAIAAIVALPPLGARMLGTLRGVLEHAHRLEPHRAAWEVAGSAILTVAAVAGLVMAGAVAAVDRAGKPR